MPHRLLINVGIEMLAKSESGRLEAMLSELVESGLLLCIDHDADTSMFRAGADSERNTLKAIEQLSRQFAYSIRIGPLQVAYRETLTTEAESDFSHKRLVNGKGQFARVKLKLTPIDMSMDCMVTISSPDLTAKNSYALGAERGVRSVFDAGPFAGFPVTGIEVTIEDAAWHQEDSSELAFEIAARAAVREGMARGSVALAEPIMEMELQSEEAIPAALRYELNLRKAWMTGHRESVSGSNPLFMIPLANSFGLAEILESRFGSKIATRLEFSHYAVIATDEPPPAIAAALR